MTAVGRLTATPPPNTGSSDAAATPPEDGAAFGSILSEIGGHGDPNGKSASAKSTSGRHHGQEDGRDEKVQGGKPAPRKHGLAEHLIADAGSPVHLGNEGQSLPDAASDAIRSDDAGSGDLALSPPALLLVATGQTDAPGGTRVAASESPLTQQVAEAIADRIDQRAGTVSKEGAQPRDTGTSTTGGNVERFPVEARTSPPQETQPTPAPAVADVTVLGRETHFAPARPFGVAPPAIEPDHDDAADETVGKEPAGGSARSPGLVPEAHATKIDLTGKHNDGAPGDHDAPGPAVSSATPAAPADGGGLPSSTLHRLASAIADTAASAPSAPVAGSATVALAPVAAAGPVKVLTVRLDLAESGALDVRMVADGGTLTIHVRTEKDETARRLHNDRDELASLLRGAGYDATIATIESRRTDAGAPPSGQPAAPGPAVTSQGDQGGAFQEPRQQGRGGHAFPFAGERETSHDTSKPDGRGAGLLYV